MSRNIHASILSATACVLLAVSCGDDEPVVDGAAGSSSSAGKGGGGTSAGDGGMDAGGKSNGGSPTAGSGGSNPTGGSASGTMNAGGEPSGDAGQPAMGGADPGGAGGETNGGEGGAPPVDLGPILKYEFEDGTGTVVTDSAHDFDGTANDASVWSPDGRNGGALALNGGNPANKYVSAPSGVLAGVSNFTMASWVKLTTSAPWHRIVDFGNSGAGTDERFLFLTPASDKGIRLSIFGGSPQNEAIVVTNTQLPLSVWKHVAVTAKDGEDYIYVDGFPAAHGTNLPIVPASELEPLAGKSWLGKSRFPDAGFDGLMDDFVVYDRPLSQTEVADLAWPKTDYSSWRFDEASGTTAKDSSDRALNGTLAGNALWTAGRQNAGVELSGTTEHVAFAGNPIEGCTTALTIGVWIKLHAAANWSRIFDFGTGASFMYLTPRNGDGALYFVMHTATEETAVVSNTTVPVDTTWHHVAVVVSPTAAGLYLDGISVANVPNPAVTPAELGALTENWLGRSRFEADPYLNASLDELRISCRAYTDDEIKNLAFK